MVRLLLFLECSREEIFLPVETFRSGDLFAFAFSIPPKIEKKLAKTSFLIKQPYF